AGRARSRTERASAARAPAWGAPVAAAAGARQRPLRRSGRSRRPRRALEPMHARQSRVRRAEEGPDTNACSRLLRSARLRKRQALDSATDLPLSKSHVRLASWNVNSIRIREPALLEWLRRTTPDVVCLQETKVIDDDFPTDDLMRLGYAVAMAG